MRIAAAVVTIQTCWKRYVTRQKHANDVILRMTTRSAIKLIITNIRRLMFRKRIHFLTQLTANLNLIKEYQHLSLPTKKQPQGMYDLLIDELTFLKIMQMDHKDIVQNIRYPEQKVALAFRHD